MIRRAEKGSQHSTELSKKKLIIPKLLILFGLILGLIAVVIFAQNHLTEPKPPSGAVQSSSDPSAVKPTAQDIYNYKVPANDPKLLSISAIGVQPTRILKLGLTKSNQIAVPDNIYDAGWYDASSRPGQSGAMFIYGHVSSWAANGIFYNLKKLRPGNLIKVTRGDNTNYTYKVVSSKIYPYNNVNMNQVLSAVNPAKPGLNLMTCTGQVIKGTSEFNERLVVFTSLVNS